MYNKKDIVKILNEYNYFIDESTLSSFIKNWKIDAIYEDEDGVEFFDNLSIAKLKKGISLKSQGYANDLITFHIKKLLEEKNGESNSAKVSADKEMKSEVVTKASATSELQNVTVDVTGQTLQMLADAVADKITAGIKEQIQNSEFITQLLQDGTLQKDKEDLTKKVEELTEDNKKLAKRVEELERSKKLSPINFEFFKKYFS